MQRSDASRVGARQVRRCRLNYPTAVLAVAAALAGAASILPVRAAPPTVTPSPGYDARLQEQRSAASIDPFPIPAAVSRHRARRAHHRVN